MPPRKPAPVSLAEPRSKYSKAAASEKADPSFGKQWAKDTATGRFVAGALGKLMPDDPLLNKRDKEK